MKPALLFLLTVLAALSASARSRTPDAEAVAAYVDAVSPMVGADDAEVTVSRLQPSRPDVWRRAKRLRSFQLQSVARPYGQLSARVEVDVPGGVESLQLSAHVEVLVPVWVTTRSVGAGEPLIDASAQLRRSLQGLSNTALRGEDAMSVEQVSTRPIPAGTVLTRANSQAPMAVLRGQRVEVVAVVGTVMVRTRGEALRNGRAGESVPVRGPGGTILETVARGPGRVEVTQ